jgi:hypothetical protein
MGFAAFGGGVQRRRRRWWWTGGGARGEAWYIMGRRGLPWPCV